MHVAKVVDNRIFVPKERKEEEKIIITRKKKTIKKLAKIGNFAKKTLHVARLSAIIFNILELQV